MEQIYKRPETLLKVPNGFCPGCGHGIISRVLAEAIDELGIREKAALVVPIGCAIQLEWYMNIDMTSGLHGRSCSVATGLKRCRPEMPVIVYQGDGDATAIGLSETLHAAARGEKLTCIMVNNSIYGMTGGQMSPTTLPGMVTTTSQSGRDAELTGQPVKMAELVASMDSASFVARTTVTDPKHVMETKRVIKTAIEKQINEGKYSFIEILSPCPVGWKMSPDQSMKFIQETSEQYFKVGVLKNI